MSEHDELVKEFTAVLRLFVGAGRYAVTLGGSRAKTISDARSDYDFRVYADRWAADDLTRTPGEPAFEAAKAKWEARGCRIDGYWPRAIADIDAGLDRWIGGDITPDPLFWAVWGYHLPTDIATQQSIEDPDGVVAGWHARLRVYPPALKAAVLRKHLEFVRYWRDDYHYVSKVERGDRIFLAGVSAKIVHSLSQLLFAINEVYFRGDGWNDQYIRTFRLAPPTFSERAEACLYPAPGPDQLARQRLQLVELINEVEALV